MIERLRLSSRSLPFRIAALLALTLLPIGLISVTQTALVSKQQQERAQSALLALTADAASGEEGQIRTAIGAAKAIAATLPGLRASGWDCRESLIQLLDTSGIFSFAGYIDGNGDVVCASGGDGLNVSDEVGFKMMRDNPVTRVSIILEAPISKTAVVVTSVPILRPDGSFDGYVGVSLPHRQLFREADQLAENTLIDLITFNSDGVVLTSDGGVDSAAQRLPVGSTLQSLMRGGPSAFAGRTSSGDERIFAFVPIIDGAVYALGVWEHPDNAPWQRRLNMTNSVIFPVAMWLACLAVAFFAVQRMVIRPTRNLRARMLQFMRTRKISPMSNEATVPLELQEMNETWQRLATSVLHDEAELQNTIHAKTVLLKEVHHRVKNNLQLIASILNMKIRKSANPEAKTALAEIQQRVMSLSRVHQQLYETSTAAQVRADELLSSMISQIISGAGPEASDVHVTSSFAPLTVYPDQAVPLSLTVSELVTNALKYMGRDSDGKARLNVRLWVAEDGNAMFEITNTLRDQTTLPPCDGGSSGLGEKLIRAFVMQMEGKMTVTTENGLYSVRLCLPVAAFSDPDAHVEKDVTLI